MTATLDWMGCATFRLTLGEQVILLDAYIDRVASAAPTGATVDAIWQADWIVVGHSHFDHLYGAERIAKNTGAKIIGSYESIRIMAAQGVPEEQLLPVAGGEARPPFFGCDGQRLPESAFLRVECRAAARVRRGVYW